MRLWEHSKRDWAERAAAFFLPSLLLLSVLAVFGVYPFGEKTLLVVDMNSEYIDYLAYLNDSVRTGGSFLRSWNMGMGLNMLGLIAFYTASPFNLIVLAMPVAYITEAVLLVTLLKIGACGLFFHIYSQKVFRLGFHWRLLFSSAYALMGYNLFYSSNIMWLDGVALLPLVLLGVERILREAKPGVFFLSLVFVFFSSYYIGYMIGVFSFLYFLMRYFCGKRPFRLFLRRFWLFLGSAALAAGCCAFLLLPAFLNLKNGQSALWDIPMSFELRRGIVGMSAKLLPGAYDSLTDSGLPNLYFSMFGLLSAVCFFLNKGVPAREKLIAGGLCAFLILSLSCEILDLAWHAFEDPTWFPARYSFVFSFLGLYLGLRGMEKQGQMKPPGLLAAFLILLVLFTEVGIGGYSFLDQNVITVGLFFLTAYALLSYAGIRGKRQAAYIMVGLLCCELWYSSYGIVTGIDNQFRYRDRSEYTGYRADWAPAIASLPRDGQNPYRTELAELRNANGALALGYNSISHYSTTTDQNVNALLQRLSYNTGTINELRFSPGSPVASGLLGIRYILSREPLGGIYIPCRIQDGVTINENPLAYPLAFYADSVDIPADGADPFLLQNSWARGLWNEPSSDIFSPAEAAETLYNVAYRKPGNGAQLYSRQVRGEEGRVEWTIDNPEGNEVYAWFEPHGKRFSRALVSVNGEDRGRILAYRSNPTIPLGSDKEITLAVHLEADSLSFAELHLYSLNAEAALAQSSKARQHQMSFYGFDDTRVEGEIDAPSDGFVATTFPFDTGWTIMVDGRKTEPRPHCGVFLAFPVSKGSHAVSMHYSPPGFVPGIVVSAASWLFAVISWIRRRHGNHRESTEKGKS